MHGSGNTRVRGTAAMRATAGVWATAGVLALAGTSALMGTPVAAAGEYHVYSCRTPDGGVAPVDGWTGSPQESSSPSSVFTEDKCAKGGALVAALADGTTHEVGTDVATWTLTVPAGETATKMTLWRAGDAEGGSGKNATYQFWIAAPNESEGFDECLYALGCTKVIGEPEEPMSLSNVLAVPIKDLGGHVYLNASCGGLATYTCPSGKGDANGYAAVVYLYAADLILEQTSQPTVSGVEGELATASTLSGTADLSFHAEDSGSGVYEAVFTVDGSETGRTVLDEDGGHCREVGQATDGLPDFLYLQPCPASLTADVPFDTTALSDGTHHLVVSVTDAAGNSTVVLDRKITVSNDPPGSQQGSPESPSPQPSPSPKAQTSTTPTSTPSSSPNNPATQSQGVNGQNASAGATLTVRWNATPKVLLASSYGAAHTVTGRLTAPNGAPIVGATLQALYTPAREGAGTVALASPRTSVNGGFSVHVPVGVPSSRLTFAYSSHLGQPAPDVTATLSLSVAAGLSLRVTPRTSHAGGTIVFNGTLHGTPIPPGGKQLVLEARTPGAAWRQFQVLPTNAHGGYRSAYRFRLPGPVLYEFRAVSPGEADFPYATGTSNVVEVHER
jgi:hypothetical protein